MSTSESFRGNVPTALEELRQPRSGGCLVWFFELLWAYCPESRGLKGTESQPGIMHDSSAAASSSSVANNSNTSNNNGGGTTTKEGPAAPDILWRIMTSEQNNNNGQHSKKFDPSIDNTSVFGTWDENPDEMNTADPNQPHDDFLWLPVLPPTVLLNFSRIQSWYFTPKTRMQMQREIAFYSVADEEETSKVYSSSSKNNKNGPTPQNDIDRLLAQFHEQEKENKKKRDSSVRNKFKELSTSANNMMSMSSSANALVLDLPEPEHQFTLGQRQVLGIRAIAEKYKREHSSNADELPAPVLKRLRGRLSTSVIVDAFEREYIQGLKVDNVTSNGLAMAQAKKDKNGGDGGGGGGLLAQMMSMEEEDDGKKKKRSHNIRHYPAGWVCPEGSEQKELQYDRIVAQLIRKAPDHYNSSSHHNKDRRRRGKRNNNSRMMNDDDDDGDESSAHHHYPQYNNDNNDDDDDEDDNYTGGTNASRFSANKSRGFKSLPSAATTAELLTSSLCSPQVEYLTMESLRRVLCSGTLGQAALLQQFVPPPAPTAVGNARYNETLDFRWQPRWRYLERSTNAHPLDDWTVPANKRGPTFEGPPGSSQGAMLGHATLYRLERACRAIVRHVFNVSQHTARILRLHCIFKFDERLSLVLLCVVEATAINPRAVPPATTIANILNADAHLPRFRTAQAQQRQQEQQQQIQAAQQQQNQLLKITASSGSGMTKTNSGRLLGSNNNLLRVDSGMSVGAGSDSGSMNNNNNNTSTRPGELPTREERAQYMQQRQQHNNSRLVSASLEGEVTATGWAPQPLDPDDIRRSPIRAVAAMSRGEARHAAVKRTMKERLGAIQSKKEMQMIVDTQGMVKPVEQLRKEADAAFAAMNPKAAKDLAAMFSRREKRRALMKAQNSSAFDDDEHTMSHHHQRRHDTDELNDTTTSSNQHDQYSSSSPSFAAGSASSAITKKKRRTVNPLNEAIETVDDLLWGRQSQLARALLRPVASREEARKLPFHRRPARSLAAECGASGVGDRYISTMRSVSTPEPGTSSGSIIKNIIGGNNSSHQNSSDVMHQKSTKIIDPKVRHRRAFC